MALMGSNSNLKTVWVTERSENFKSFEIERGSRLVSVENIDIPLTLADMANHKVKSNHCLPSALWTSAGLKQFLSSQALSILEDFAFVSDDHLSNERMNSICDALKGNTFHLLISFSFYLDMNINEDQVLMLLSSISMACSELKHLTIFYSHKKQVLTEAQLCGIIRYFAKLEEFEIKGIRCETITNQAPFPPTNSLTKLELEPVQPAIPLLFGSLRH